jgi:hypothetical protein
VDDGRGFDPNVTGYGTGLQGIVDRVAANGGTVQVRSAPGAGTSLNGRIPAGSDPVPIRRRSGEGQPAIQTRTSPDGGRRDADHCHRL